MFPSIVRRIRSVFSPFLDPQEVPIVKPRPRRIVKPSPPRILLNDVSCMRNAQTVLRWVNISAHDGSAIVLTGVNGSGKTTFLRMLAGFSRPSEGEVLWNGHDIQSPGVFQQYKLQLNWLSLKDAIQDKLTVLHNVEWFEVLEGKSGKSMWALELMGIGRLAKESVKMLSSGQRKRLQLARLLAIDRPIWLLDEPSVALDVEGVKLLEYIIGEHRRKGGIVLGVKLLEYIIGEHRRKGGIVFVATHQPIEIEAAEVSEEDDSCRYAPMMDFLSLLSTLLFHFCYVSR